MISDVPSYIYDALFIFISSIYTPFALSCLGCLLAWRVGIIHIYTSIYIISVEIS
jgi:hypothetical protein